jgi:hypothetical protein
VSVNNVRTIFSQQLLDTLIGFTTVDAAPEGTCSTGKRHPDVATRPHHQSRVTAMFLDKFSGQFDYGLFTIEKTPVLVVDL